jgi:isovaleryl-CoA dehydrogenase
MSVLSAGPVGLMQEAFDVTMDYIRTREQFGKPIGEFQLMQGKIADMYTKLQSSRSWLYVMAALADEGKISNTDAASLCLLCSDNGVDVTMEAIQALGGNGYTNEYPTGRLMRVNFF